MAKKRNSRSEKIRQQLKLNPGASPSVLAKEFGVSKALVYNIKSDLRSEGEHADTGKQPPAARASINGAPATGKSPEPLVLAAKLIKSCGSVQEAERALKTASLVASTLQ